MAILDLPQDALLLILLHLAPLDYLNFCSACHGVEQYRADPSYWRTKASSTFRIPISPLLAADGPRWYSLYKKLKTQTRLYTWGQGRKGSLGQGRAPIVRNPRGRVIPTRPVPRLIFQRVNSTWPTESHVPDEVGIIADLQCGGWSTTILSASGRLYTTGSLDSLDGITIGETTDQYKQLEYITQSTSSIRQFSSGRRHVLALTDDGEILSWDRINAKGLKPFSRSGRDFGGKPTRVCAGWDISSAYVPEVGIVYWTPLKNDQADPMLDGIHIKDRIIPDTAVRTVEGTALVIDRHVVLAEFIVWITSDSKIYACGIGGEAPDQTQPSGAPFEVPGFAAKGREFRDVQGQFTDFGVFTAAGEVMAGNIDYLRLCATAIQRDTALRESGDWFEHQNVLSSRPQDVPSLQHTGVIALAYGDHHYMALHADGRISSLGRDSGSCGQMGLGDPVSGARFRGLHRNAMQASRDGFLLPIAEKRGRKVWFEPEKKDWLNWLVSR
jgi:SCF-associated factor 1